MIVIFYHCRLSQPPAEMTGPPDKDFAMGLFKSQMAHVRDCGLWDEANYRFLGFNDDQLEIGYGCRGADINCHGSAGRSEANTLQWLQQMLPSFADDTRICYFHAKGVKHPGDPLTHAWRMCMENVVLGHWRECLSDLQAGYDMAGAHWLTREQYPVTDVRVNGYVVHGYGMWGGNFWWANAGYLKTLAPIIPSTNAEEDYVAERWTGTGRLPKVHDYRPHWPSQKDCGENA